MRTSILPFLFLAANAAAQTINVNPAMSTAQIQVLINGNPGATFVFAPGTYLGSLTIPFDVVLQGSGANVTTIDAQGALVSVLTIQPGVTRNTIVSGLRLTGGMGDPLSSFGGGVFCQDAAPILRACEVSGNMANSGAGVYVYGQLQTSGRSLLMEDCTITRNVSSNNGGGVTVTKALNANPGAAATFVRCLIEGNDALGDGGGVAIFNAAAPTLDHCLITRNTAVVTGGGVRWYEWCAPTVTACLIAENVAGTGGGISYRETGAAVVEHCSVLHNVATDTFPNAGGGGLLGFQDSAAGNLILRNCLFAGNVAALDGGGMMLIDTAPVLRFVTVAANNASGLSGGIRYSYSSSAPPARFVLRNSIVRKNSHGGPAASFTANLDGTVATTPVVLPTIAFSNVQFGSQNPALFPPPSNIDADPLFVTGYSCVYAPDGTFFLAQVPEGVFDNPCVDTAGAPITHPSIVGRCTRTDGRADGGNASDMGFHYPVPGCP